MAYALYILLCTPLTACQGNKNSLPMLPEDSLILPLIAAKYTAQNRLDGSEYATVDSLKVLEKKYDAQSMEVKVIYYISCSYQPAAHAPDVELSAPPPLQKTDSLMIKLDNENWKLVPENR